MQTILSADIGGTNSRFAHFTLREGVLAMEHSVWLPTQEAGSFGELLEMLEGSDFSLPPKQADAAVLAIAGAVEKERRCAPVNIPWSLDLDAAGKQQELAPALLVNDFVAQAYATSTAAVDDATQILPGTAAQGGAKAVIGAGTGLGKCALMPLPDGGFCAVPSEGGHSEFPFVSDEEFEFARFARAETGRSQLIGDIVVAGRGLELLHAFFTGERLDAADVSATFPGEDASAADKPESLRWYSRFYARSCRNYTLEVLASGGLFIAGGVAARVPVVVRCSEFAEEFRSSETHGKLLGSIPVMLNANQNSGLWGAAAIAAQRILGNKVQAGG